MKAFKDGRDSREQAAEWSNKILVVFLAVDKKIGFIGYEFLRFATSSFLTCIHVLF